MTDTSSDRLKKNAEATRKIIAVFEEYEAENKKYWEGDFVPRPITLSPGQLSSETELSVQKIVALAKSQPELFEYKPGYRKYSQGCIASRMEAGYYEASVTWKATVYDTRLC